MKRKFSSAIKKIAKREDIAPELVYAEMETAINIGYNNLDPSVQSYWQKMFPNGKPTPEEFVEAMANSSI